MSIYPVRLSQWFPVGDEMHNNAYHIVKSLRCLACDKKLRSKSPIGHHSVPWGNGDVWCSEKCCYLGRIAKPDRRRNRRFKRKFGDLDYIPITIPVMVTPKEEG